MGLMYRAKKKNSVMSCGILPRGFQRRLTHHGILLTSTMEDTYFQGPPNSDTMSP